MNSDESPRGMQYPSSRKPLPPKSQGYSPSSNYNYGNQSQHGNNHGNHGNQNFGNQQHQRRKPMPFKCDNHGSGGSGGGASDKLIKQNDIIIRLLKEIRDRLPPPPASVAAESAETSETDIVDEGTAIVQEQEPVAAEPVAEQDVVEAEPEPEPEPEELGPPPPKAARRPSFSDEELDLQANGNR